MYILFLTTIHLPTTQSNDGEDIKKETNARWIFAMDMEISNFLPKMFGRPQGDTGSQADEVCPDNIILFTLYCSTPSK